MQCPTCGNTALLPIFKFCPACGSQLPLASSEGIEKEKEGIAQTTCQQGLAGNNDDLRVDDRQIHGEERQLQPQHQQQQQQALTIVKEDEELSATQSIKPTGIPNADNCSASVERGQPYNPLENDHDPVNLQVTPIMQSEDLKEADAEKLRSGQRKPCLGTRRSTTDPTSSVQEEEEQICDQGKDSQGSITSSTDAHVTSVQIVRGAAELEECNSNGSSDVAKVKIVPRESKVPPWHMTSDDPHKQQQQQQQKLLQAQQQPSQQEQSSLSQEPQQKRQLPSLLQQHLQKEKQLLPHQQQERQLPSPQLQQPQPSFKHHQQQRKQHVSVLEVQLRPPKRLSLPQKHQQQQPSPSPPPPPPQQQQLPPRPQHQQQQQLPQQQELLLHPQPQQQPAPRPQQQQLPPWPQHQQQLPLPSQQQQLPPRLQQHQQLPPLPTQQQQLVPQSQQQQELPLPPQQQEQQVPPRPQQQQQLPLPTQQQQLPLPTQQQQLPPPPQQQQQQQQQKHPELPLPPQKLQQQRPLLPQQQQASEASNGHWYQKKDNQPQDVTIGQRSNKGLRKDEKSKAGHQLPKTSLLSFSLKQGEPENGVTVVFHVLLVSNFKMEEEHLHIRAHEEDLGNFQVNCVDMELVGNGRGKDKNKLLRFSGQCTLSMDRAKRGTDYKYVLLKKGIVHWEYLTEFRSRYHGGIVNRFLSIPDKYLKPGAIWHQFDGVAYIHGDKSWWARVYDYFRREETVENRTTALLTYLPKWKGFLVNEPGEDMTATEALVELDKVVGCLTNVSVRDSNLHPEKKKPSDFNIQTVLVDFLQPKMMENAATLTQRKTDLNARASAMVSSLAIVLLLKKYSIGLTREFRPLLLKCLALEVDPTAKSCTPYEVVLQQFSEGLRGFAAECIEELCNETMADPWKADWEWLFAVPLLHFLREDSKPFEEPHMTGAYNKLEWIGAQKLRIKEFQRSDKQNLSDSLPQFVAAFEVDRLLKRTFLHAIPVWELHKVVSSNMFHVSDICVALVTFCSRDRVPNSKWMNVGECIKLMISLLEEKNETAGTSVENLEFTSSMCLKLLEVCLKELTFRGHMEIICMLIKLLLTSIQRQRQEMLGRSDAEERQAKEEDLMQNLLRILKSSLTSNLPTRMCNHYESDRLLRELEDG